MKLLVLGFTLFTPLLLAGPCRSAEPGSPVKGGRAPVSTFAPADPCSYQERTTSMGHGYVRFEGPTGRKVNLLFSSHMDPGLQADLQTLLNAKIKDRANAKSIQDLARQIHGSHRDILVAKRRELHMLNDLNSTARIRWLGVELPDSEVAKARPHLYMERIQLEKSLAQAGLGLREMDDLVLLMQDSIQYWLSQQPERIRTYKWIGVENDDAHGKALKSAEQIHLLTKALAEYEKLNPKSDRTRLKDLEAEIGAILDEKRTQPQASEKKLIQRFPSSETQGLAQAQIQAARDLLEASAKRDQFIAQKIVNDVSGDGILTIGRAHRATLLDDMLLVCRKRLTR